MRFANRYRFHATMRRVAQTVLMNRSHMKAAQTIVVLLLLSGFSGCWHCNCPPKDLFSCIDRNCFVADWMNEHSCLSCRHCANNDPPTIGCRPYTGDTDPVPSSDRNSK